MCEVSMNVCVCERRSKDKNIFRGKFVFLIHVKIKSAPCSFGEMFSVREEKDLH